MFDFSPLYAFLNEIKDGALKIELEIRSPDYKILENPKLKSYQKEVALAEVMKQIRNEISKTVEDWEYTTKKRDYIFKEAVKVERTYQINGLDRVDNLFGQNCLFLKKKKRVSQKY